MLSDELKAKLLAVGFDQFRLDRYQQHAELSIFIEDTYGADHIDEYELQSGHFAVAYKRGPIGLELIGNGSGGRASAVEALAYLILELEKTK